ncbi:MAG: DUF433 domain-containing protein [Promethearchaeota archaeon]
MSHSKIIIERVDINRMKIMSKFSRIVRNPEICGGQPTIHGTRVLVIDILDWIKEGESFDSILQNFPSISKSDIQEIIKYAQEVIAGEVIIYGNNETPISS